MTAIDDDSLHHAQVWKEQGRRVALATVIETWGVAPRPVGSHLVVDADRAVVGSVAGGCIEADVVEEALRVIATGVPKLFETGVADETARAAGLTCGGRIRVFVERLD